VLERLFSQYGIPKEILTDNGSSFTSVWTTGRHQFDAFCESHSIEHKLIRPYYPECNGKAEALVKTVKRECISCLDLPSLDPVSLQKELSRFQDYYNWYRLHSGISYKTPTESYCGVRVKQTFLAVPQLETISIPQSPEPENVPTVDTNFIHRHTALMPI